MLPFEPLPFQLLSADEIALAVAGRARTRRLQRGWTQIEAAERSGMTLASYKRFERTGEIAFKSLLKVAVALGQIHQFESLFELPTYLSLDEAVQTAPQRQRAPRRRPK